MNVRYRLLITLTFIIFPTAFLASNTIKWQTDLAQDPMLSSGHVLGLTTHSSVVRLSWDGYVTWERLVDMPVKKIMHQFNMVLLHLEDETLSALDADFGFQKWSVQIEGMETVWFHYPSIIIKKGEILIMMDSQTGQIMWKKTVSWPDGWENNTTTVNNQHLIWMTQNLQYRISLDAPKPKTKPTPYRRR